jgi:iron(III) transport system ATP-binding protein
MAQSVILHLDSVTKQFSPTTAPAVSSVTLTLHQGELLGLLGPSGCGKTTLLRLIAGFEQLQSGSIELAGAIVAGAGRWMPPEKRSIGMVFQDYALFPHLTVAKNIAFGLQHTAQRPLAAVKKQVKKAITLVGLEGMENRYPHQLSGGQQQRVALARALAPHPTLILLDEPLSNLDVQVSLRLRQELHDILKAAGTSGILVTHDQEEALSICDRVAVMCNGQVEQVGTPEELYQEPASRFVAEFVTQANFILARRHGRVWETEIGCFALGSDLDSLNQTELMIRQEDLMIYPDDAADIIIRAHQFLGRDRRYCLRTPSGRELIARTLAETSLPVGTRVRISVAKQAIRVFPTSKAQSPSYLSPAFRAS